MDVSGSKKRTVVFCFCVSVFLAGAVLNAGAQERKAILARGNTWTTGIPGFEDNVFPALLGEYRLEFSAPGSVGAEPGAPGFSVWLSGEPLLFSGDVWQRRSSLGNLSAMQRQDGESVLVSLPVRGDLGAYTVIFQFPRGIAASALDENAANQLVRTWAARFLYFFSLIRIPTDVSLPAVVDF
jgi:hypothetical protein